MTQHAIRTLLLILLFAIVLRAQTPQPHAGWQLVPGAEDLIVDGYWDDCYLVGTPPAVIQVNGGVLTATAVNGYSGGPDVLAPRLQTTGDFGVVATIRTAPGMNGLVTLTGALTSGTQYWQGWKWLEFGIDNNGNYVFAYWDGTQENPAVYQILKGFSTPPTGTVTMELLRQQGQFFLYFSGTQYGPFADPGLFGLGFAIAGFSLFPSQQMTLTQLAFEIPSGDTTAQLITPVGVVPYNHPAPSLGSLAAATGRTFGDAVGHAELPLGFTNILAAAPDPTYAPKLIGEYNAIINAQMYYFMTETGQGDFTFGGGDELAAYAEDNWMPAHCHHLIGPNIYLPGWLVNGTFTSAQLSEILTNHVRTVVSHFRGQCSSWDVVNEALDSNGNVTTTNNIWAQVIGPSYIDLAFQTAHQADPNAKLYYNDYNIENQTPKTAGLYNFLAGLQQRGIPIDGLGLQCHWSLSSGPDLDSMVANMAQLAHMGLSARISEMDVRLLLPPSASDLANQETMFTTTVQACLQSPNCVSINTWGADDANSWIPGAFPGYGDATLFDASFNPKPAYTKVLTTLQTGANAVPVAPQYVSGAEVLPQLAFGGGWYSALYFTNFRGSAVSTSIGFTSDAGTPLDIPSAGGSLVQENLPPYGTAIIEAPNSGGLVEGDARFTLPPGVFGYGVFRQSVPGIADQEAVVPFSSSGATSSMLTWDETVSTTAVAIVNPSAAAATVAVKLWDSGGNAIGTTTIQLAPNAKTEAVLHSLSGLSGMVGKLGSAQFTASSGDVAVLGLRFRGAAFTSIPTTAAAAATAQSEVLPQFAFGGGWYSALYFTNFSETAASFSINFIGDSGTPLTVPSVGGSTSQVNLPPYGTATIEAPNAGSLVEGYATFTLPPGVFGYGVFRQSVAGIADQEAVVPFSSSGATSSALTWDETVSTTAVAIVNPSSTAATVAITVWGADGNTIGTASVPLAPNSKTEAVLRSLAGLSGMAGKRGSAQFTVLSGDVAVLGLRFRGSAFTSIPTTNPGPPDLPVNPGDIPFARALSDRRARP